MIVLDASAAIEWLLQTSKADAVEARLFANARTSQGWHAPQLLDVEVAQVLRKLLLVGTLSASRANEALADLIDLPLIRYLHDWLLRRIWELRHSLTATMPRMWRLPSRSRHGS